jgi:peptidoglycan/LPS O-acetylase OafA/YrhL
MSTKYKAVSRYALTFTPIAFAVTMLIQRFWERQPLDLNFVLACLFCCPAVGVLLGVLWQRDKERNFSGEPLV